MTTNHLIRYRLLMNTCFFDKHAVNKYRALDLFDEMKRRN